MFWCENTSPPLEFNLWLARSNPFSPTHWLALHLSLCGKNFNLRFEFAGTYSRRIEYNYTGFFPEKKQEGLRSFKIFKFSGLISPPPSPLSFSSFKPAPVKKNF